MITGVSTGMPYQRARLLNCDQICFTMAVIETHLTKQSRRGVSPRLTAAPHPAEELMLRKECVCRTLLGCWRSGEAQM